MSAVTTAGSAGRGALTVGWAARPGPTQSTPACSTSCSVMRRGPLRRLPVPLARPALHPQRNSCSRDVPQGCRPKATARAGEWGQGRSRVSAPVQTGGGVSCGSVAHRLPWILLLPLGEGQMRACCAPGPEQCHPPLDACPHQAVPGLSRRLFGQHCVFALRRSIPMSPHVSGCFPGSTLPSAALPGGGRLLQTPEAGPSWAPRTGRVQG